MAHISASPQTANVKDGDKSPTGDLEEGEIEDGELPEEEAETNRVGVNNSVKEHTSTDSSAPVVSKNEKTEKQEKVIETPLGRLSRRKAAHHNVERNNELEEEWACVVEKKLKAAMNKDTNVEKLNGSPTINCDSVVADEDKKNRRKKRKKKHKDGDDDITHKILKKRRRSHHRDVEDGQETIKREKVNEDDEDEEEDEDDDEMLFVRGASPIMRGHSGEESSPTCFTDKGFSFNQSGGFEDTYESYNEEEEEFDSREEFGRLHPPMSDDEAPKRGIGRGVKRRQRAGGRNLPPSKRQARKDIKNKRGGPKRQQSSRNNSERENVCMFWMQGKCQKGDGCTYSHNALPPRKLELCKFYLMDCCAKKDKCLYMHHDFPCKFFHTGLKCFSGPRCKFSHGHLSDTMRNILFKATEGSRHNELRISNRSSAASQEHRSKHGETAAKEAQGDFPRGTREGAAAAPYSKKTRGSKGKKIPSLFDIEIPIPVQLLAEQKDPAKDQSPRRTPMPESDNEDQDGTTTPMPQSPVAESKPKERRTRWSTEETGISSQGSHSRESNEHDEKFIDSDLEKESKVLIPKFYQETDIETASDKETKKKVEKERGLNLHRLAGYSPNPCEEKEFSGSEKSSSNDKESKKKKEEDSKYQNENGGDSGTESNDAANIPLHLPKKQRELFLRIQQQQREAESSQDQNADHEEETDEIPEENWYSSDEEEDSLTSVLKNLSKQEQQIAAIDASNSANVTTDAASDTVPNSLPVKLPDLSKIDISESFTKLLKSIYRPNTSEDTTTAAAPPVSSTPEPTISTLVRDPRLSRDPRHRSQPAAPGAAGNASALTSHETAPSSTATAPSSVLSSALSSSSSAPSPAPSSAPSSAIGSYEPVRRRDPRRHGDPRSARPSKNDMQEPKQAGSVSSRRNSSGSTTLPNIYSNAIMGDPSTSHSGGLSLGIGGSSSSGDVDLRSFISTNLETGDVDLRRGNRRDTDLRTGQAAALSFGDTDLRVRSQENLSVAQLMDSSRGSSDVDLRRMLELPFKPVPLHTPATEIDASLTSHPPIVYKVVPVSIPRPDYTNLKLTTADPQVQSDPRLRKIFKLCSPGTDSQHRNPLGSPVAMAPSRNDPRRQANRSSGTGNSGSASGISDQHARLSEPYTSSVQTDIISQSPSDVSAMNSGHILMSPGARNTLPTQAAASPLLPNPRVGRDPRNAPGILGPAPLPPNYCPSTPVYEEKSDSQSGIDNDPRLMFGRNTTDMQRWDQQPQAPQQQLGRNNWKQGRRNQARYMEKDPRSYTPPM